MGLDQHAFRVKKNTLKTPTDNGDRINDDAEEIAYWRKHPNLQGWMEDLYFRKGGKESSFNCVDVQLTWEDLEELEKDINEQQLPETKGFFFGDNSDDYYKKEDLQFIEKALEDIKDGYEIYYTSWW